MEDFLKRYYTVIFSILLVAIAGLSFYVGMIKGQKSANGGVVLACSEEVLSKLSILVKSLVENNVQLDKDPSLDENKGKYAGSKNGTKYYTPNCSGLNRIKLENIIWFQDEEEAILQGYSAAKC